MEKELKVGLIVAIVGAGVAALATPIGDLLVNRWLGSETEAKNERGTGGAPGARPIDESRKESEPPATENGSERESVEHPVERQSAGDETASSTKGSPTPLTRQPPERAKEIPSTQPPVEPILAGSQDPQASATSSSICAAVVEGPSGLRRRLYSIPSRNAPSTAALRAGDPVQVLDSRIGEGMTWYRITSDQTTGWLLKDHLELRGTCAF